MIISLKKVIKIKVTMIVAWRKTMIKKQQDINSLTGEIVAKDFH